MKYLKIITPFLLVIIFVACNNDQSQKQVIRNIDIAGNINNMKQINLSRFADEIKYIPLETNPELVLGDYLNFDISEEHILTSDRKLSLVLFDRSGKFIRRFGHGGRGPEEYQSVENLSIVGNKIYFSSTYDLFVFNTDGDFENKYPKALSFGGKHLLEPWDIVDDSLIFGHITNDDGQTETKAMLVNMQGEIKQSFTNHDILEIKGSRINGGSTQVYEFAGTLSFKEQFTDTLFSLDENYKLSPRYSFDMGNLKMPETVRSNFYEYFQKMNDFIAVEDIFETENYLFLKVNYDNRFPAKRLTPKQSTSQGGNPVITNITDCLGIFDKNKNELIFCKPTDTDNPLYTSGIYNDIDGGPRFFPVKTVNDSTMIMIVSAKELKEHIASENFRNSTPKYAYRKEQLEELANRLSENDNPVLMFVTF